MVNIKPNKIIFYLLTVHLLVWTLIPYISNNNLPRDTIEALAWGSNLEWGFDKHPPFSAFAVEIFYKIFGNKDWAYYLLSQIFVITAFFTVYKFSEDFFNNKKFALLSVFLLEGIYFYNFTTPEFNVNVAQLPFWALTVYFSWRCIKYDKVIDYILLGVFIGLGILSKYLFIYIVIAIKIVFLYFIKKGKKIKSSHFFIAGPISLIILFPHLMWLTENNFITITYGLHRSSDVFYSGYPDILNHIKYPFLFFVKQFGLLIPFLLMLLLLISKIQTKLKFSDKKLLFLLAINIIPVFFIFLTSLFFGINIRTMWMTPFYLFFGVLFIYIYNKNINLRKIKKFYYILIFFFVFSPSLYFFNSTYKKDQRIDYPAKEISQKVEEKWKKNFKNNINYVVGQAWWAGNLSYHLKTRPKYIRGYLNFTKQKLVSDDGVVYIESESSKLTKKCPGVYFVLYSRYICMDGNK